MGITTYILSSFVYEEKSHTGVLCFAASYKRKADPYWGPWALMLYKLIHSCGCHRGTILTAGEE